MKNIKSPCKLSVCKDFLLLYMISKKDYSRFLKCRGVSIDTRTITEDMLYCAIKGANFDGNDFVHQAFENGASLAISSSTDYKDDERVIYAADTLKYLQELAKHHRAQMKNIPVIGLTGSNGKTTTKELLHQVLSAKYKVHATAGNYNNHIGVPLTLLNTSRDAEIVIVEMGTNQPGDIKELCEIATPNFGVITNIGSSHLEKLISEEGVYREKSILFNYVTEERGTIFQNVGDKYLKTFESTSTKTKIISYSKSHGAYGILSIAPSHNNSLSYKLSESPSSKEYQGTSNFFGAYNLENISCVLTIGHSFNLPIDLMIERIAAYEPGNMRSQIILKEDKEIILDAYNANPSSMMAALEGVEDFENTTFILGDMLELGPIANEKHQEIIDYLRKQNANQVLLVGSYFKSTSYGSFNVFEKTDDLISSGLLNQLKNQHVIIKASRGMRLEKTIEHIQ